MKCLFGALLLGGPFTACVIVIRVTAWKEVGFKGVLVVLGGLLTVGLAVASMTIGAQWLNECLK